MYGYHIFNRQAVSAYLSMICCAFLMILTVGCGDEATHATSPDDITTDAAGTGSAMLTIQWQSASTVSYAADEPSRQALDNCSSAGVAFITAIVYDESNTAIADSPWWSCEDRGGQIERIPAGTSRMIAVLGWDAARETILYQGHTDTGIEIIPGEITDAGTIVAQPFIPSGLAANASSTNQIGLTWDEVGENNDVDGYQIYRDGMAIATSDTPSYEDNTPSPGIQYCYTIAAYDLFGNESGQGPESCAMTEPSDDDVDDDGDGYSEVQGDCNDANAEVYPGATERCNGIDDNCAGDIDEGLSTDADGDGHYTPESCMAPADDCDDTDDGVYSGATEICGDRIDQDCNGADLSCDDVDNDGDGFSEVQGDCDDADADVHPDATEICNGINDNCAGGIDEGLSTDADGDRHYAPGSCLTPADDCDDSRASVHPGAAETCNGIDDNCTGGIDERLSRPTSCGQGACADNTGTVTCEAGVWTNNTCNPFAGAAEETCDNVDNDCDGTVDEELSRTTTCGQGACAGNTGTATCSAGDWTDTCDPTAGAERETCDNVDNDCDGSVDEGLRRQTTCGVGACAGNTGTATCSAGDWTDTCNPTAGAGRETCDNVDNDCDGSVDEGLSRQTTCGQGACAGNTGTGTCSAGDWTDTCNPTAGAGRETCDNVDNDCDGSVDEGLRRQTTCGQGACAGNTGTATCSAGDWEDDCDPLAGAGRERCDNVDNDCDGSVDEGLSRATTCGQGACSDNTGTATCVGGAWDDPCDPYAGATTERCDDVDNDCDGSVDEGCPECYPNLNLPALDFTRREMVPISTAVIYRYFFTVTNTGQYPDDMFTRSADYEPCEEENGSRSRVEIYDNEHNLITEYCNFTSADGLESFSFTRLYPPQAVYIQIYDQECNTTYTSDLTVIAPPVQVSPENESVFDFFPRTTTLRWRTVAGASRYSVEVDCYRCCAAGQWCTDVGETWRIYTDIRDDTYTFDFVGAQPGRWRVWAHDTNGNPSMRSGWWEFEYLL